jgi:hypothetical protein
MSERQEKIVYVKNMFLYREKDLAIQWLMSVSMVEHAQSPRFPSSHIDGSAEYGLPFSGSWS